MLDNQHEAGIELLKDVLPQSPNHKLARYRFAYVIAKTGTEKEAIGWLQDLLKSKAPFRGRSKVDPLLRKLAG